MNEIYFKGLNGIRAIACLLVLLFHIDQFIPLFGIKSLGYHTSGMACYGVILFFVLSGFLITYLMLAEKKRSGQVNLMKFYKRRILRIWPAYYLAIAISAALVITGIISIAPHEFRTVLANNILLGPHIAYAFGLGILSIQPLWSVGVEEQFYSFWPLVVNRSGRMFRALLGVILVYLTVKIFLRYFEHGPLYYLISISAFDSMAIGGICAYLVFIKSRYIRLIYHPFIQVIAWLFLLISIFYKPVHIATLFDQEIHSVFYAILIVNVATNPNTLVRLENKFMNYIGTISYGIYVFHMTVVVLLAYFLKDTIQIINVTVFQYVITYVLITVFTILLSHGSYRYYESYFLRLKEKLNVMKQTRVS
jgi:peptidoglycan/LPS O-acetylase OafA/YrhL